MAIIGPNYGKPEQFEMNLSGTQFTLNSPPHNHPRVPSNACNEKALNIYDEKKFGKHPNSKEYGPLSYGMLCKTWSFFNRKFVMFLDDIAESNFDTDIFFMPEFTSLFRKEDFENAVNRLVFCYGDAYASSGMCRLNWRIEKYNSVEWAVFENDGRYSSGGLYNPCKSVIQTFYLTPISDEHVLSVYFTQVTRKEVVGLDDAFAKLRDTVMASTEVHLSEDASRQKEEIEKTYPDQKYPESLPPYEYKLMPYPNRDKARDALRAEKGNDFVNEMSDSAYSSAVDKLAKEAKDEYQHQVNDILESHLRFKKDS